MAEIRPRWNPQEISREQPATQLEWCVKQPPKQLSFLGTSFELTAAALTKTFGAFPIQLDSSHQRVLAGMAAVGGTPYAQLLQALEVYGEIEVRQA